MGSSGDSILQLPDDDLLIGGDVYDASGRMLLMRCDAEGNPRWSVSIGGDDPSGSGACVVEAADGFVVVGDEDTSPVYSVTSRDYLLAKVDDGGRIQWEKRFGSVDDEEAVDAVVVDGGFVLLGTTADVATGHTDLQLIRVDDAGEVVWSQTYGDTPSDRAVDLEATSDGGFALLGEADIVGGVDYDSEFHLVKTDGDGVVLWSQTFGYGPQSYAAGLRQTADGGYILAGSAESRAYLVKTDGNGAQLWERLFVGPSGYSDSVSGIALNSDGGFSIVGYTEFNISCHFAFVLKTDAQGNEIWSRIFGSGFTQARDITTTNDGASVLVGANYDYETSGPGGVYLAKVRASGN